MKMHENGRSMIEMLGVLAIIGVLSVGGLYAYTAAMLKYRMNEVVHVASMMAVLAKGANAGEGACIKLSDSSLPQNPGGVNVDMIAYLPGIDSDDKPMVKIQFIDGDPDNKQCNVIDNMVSDDYTIDCGESEVECDE